VPELRGQIPPRTASPGAEQDPVHHRAVIVPAVPLSAAPIPHRSGHDDSADHPPGTIYTKPGSKIYATRLDDESLGGDVASGLRVVPAGRAAARRGARHRFDRGVLAVAQGTEARHLDRLAPDAVLLARAAPL